MERKNWQTRRRFLRTAITLPLGFIVVACGGQTAANTPAQTTVQPTATAQATVTRPVASPTQAQPPTVASTPTYAPAPTTVALSPTSAPATPPVAATFAPTNNPAASVPSTAALALTPECRDGDAILPATTEGPYFTANSPQRVSLLEPGIAGTKLIITGYVLSRNCKPVARAKLDFWQADNNGQYDNSGYKLRGHQFSDEAGRFQLETVLPGLYPGRTRHIHVKVQAPNQPVLTTQLFFAGEAGNQRDSIYNSRLEMKLQTVGNDRTASFNFVVTA